MDDKQGAEGLRVETSRLQADDSLVIGKTYYLSIGVAEVVEIYEEDGLEKVKARLFPLSPQDGASVSEGRHEALFSTSTERFFKLLAQFKQDQHTRDLLRQRQENLYRPDRNSFSNRQEPTQ